MSLDSTVVAVKQRDRRGGAAQWFQSLTSHALLARCLLKLGCPGVWLLGALFGPLLCSCFDSAAWPPISALVAMLPAGTTVTDCGKGVRSRPSVGGHG